MPSVKYIPGLTPLRGIAALLVILLHYNMFVTTLLPKEAGHVIDKLYLMVDLFFVLSGFIMYHVYGSYFKVGASFKKIGGFLRARFARIYPLHLVTFLFMLGLAVLAYLGGALTGAMAIVFDFTAIPSQLLLTQAMGTHHEATFNTPSWSISVEWWAYVLFPFLLLLLARTKIWSRVLLIGLISVSYWYIMYYLQPEFWAVRWEQFGHPESLPYALHTIDVITGAPAFMRCLCGFIWGMLVYEFFKKERGKKLLKSGWAFLGVWVALFVLWHFELLIDPLAVLLFGLMILAAAYNEDHTGRILNNGFFNYMGEISYSLYLVHMPIIVVFMFVRAIMVNPDPLKAVMGYDFSPIASWLGLFAMYAIAIGVATITYRLIEKPARRYLKKSKSTVHIQTTEIN